LIQAGDLRAAQPKLVVGTDVELEAKWTENGELSQSDSRKPGAVERQCSPPSRLLRSSASTMSRFVRYNNMKTYPVTLLEIGILSGTRAIAGGGLGLLCAGLMSLEQRKTLGWSLLATGSVIYVMLMINLILRDEGFSHREATR
jgi:hypothetical protein